MLRAMGALKQCGSTILRSVVGRLTLLALVLIPGTTLVRGSLGILLGVTVGSPCA